MTRLWSWRNEDQPAIVLPLTDEQALTRLDRGDDLVPVEGIQELIVALAEEAAA